MSFTKLEADLAIHQKLDDETNDVGGLTAAELKAKFDEAGLTIQEYLNGTHLPQLEEALEDAVEEAKRYAERKVVAIGAGDMAAGVYDPQGIRQDVYRYAHSAAQLELGAAARFGYVAAGPCGVRAGTNEEAFAGPGAGFLDPRGMWSEEEGAFTAPDGARAMVFIVQVKWGRQARSEAAVELLVNGEAVASAVGPDDTTGKYVRETVVLPATVSGGDRAALRVRATGSATAQAEVNIPYFRAEIIL